MCLETRTKRRETPGLTQRPGDLVTNTWPVGYGDWRYCPDRLARYLGTTRPVCQSSREVPGSGIEAAQEVGDPRRNRLFENLAIHLPQVVADAQPDGSGNPSVDITGTYGPFRKRTGFPHIGIPHGASPSGAPPASSLQPLPTQNRSLEKSDTIHSGTTNLS